MWLEVKRYPEQRTTLVRQLIHDENLTCSWCGNRRVSHKDRPLPLFKYAMEADGGNGFELDGVFCSANCMRIFHDWKE
jgi:hypothetical protein